MNSAFIAFHSHRVFNNEQNVYPKLSLKRHQACSLACTFISLLDVHFILVLHLDTRHNLIIHVLWKNLNAREYTWRYIWKSDKYQQEIIKWKYNCFLPHCRNSSWSRDKFDITIHNRSLCWLDTCTSTSVQSGSVKLVDTTSPHLRIFQKQVVLHKSWYLIYVFVCFLCWNK